MDAPTSPTTNDGPFMLPDHLRCTYRSKACPNERARKRNGTVHKLCQDHRVKANINQRNMQKRLRARRQLELAASGAELMPTAESDDATDAPMAMASSTSFQDMLMDSEDDDWAACDLEPLCTPSELMPEDIEVLQLLWDQQQALSAAAMDTDVDMDMDVETTEASYDFEPAFAPCHPATPSTTHHYAHCAVF